MFNQPILSGLYILAAVIILLFLYRFLNRRKGQGNRERIVVSLKEIAPIWTQYNRAYNPVSLTKTNTGLMDDLFSDKRGEVQREEINQPLKEDATALSDEIVHSEKSLTAVPEGDSVKVSDDFTCFLEPLKSFWNECIQPYMEVYKAQNVADVIKELTNLLEKHGHCPSVVMDNKDRASIDLLSVRDNLAQVSLKEHTYSVARILLRLIKETYVDCENHIPKGVICALAHDMGKIPELRLTNLYNTYEHPLISANKLNELFAGKDIFWAKQAVKAVTEHHIKTSDQFISLLKQADRQARQIELLKFAKEFTVESFNNWFDPMLLLKEIEGIINHIQSKNKWEAFSFKGMAYCKPDFLYEAAKKICREKKILDLTFVYESEKESAMRRIASACREADLVSDILKADQYARRFEIVFQMNKKKFMLTPIKLSRLENLQEIENRKTGFLEIIEKVIPA